MDHKTQNTTMINNEGAKTITASTTTISNVLPDVLKICIEHVGKGNFIFVARVSRVFHDCYTYLHPGCRTSSECVALGSLEHIKLCFNEVNEGESYGKTFAERVFWLATIKGNAAIVEHAIKHLSTPKKMDSSFCSSYNEIKKKKEGRHCYSSRWDEMKIGRH